VSSQTAEDTAMPRKNDVGQELAARKRHQDLTSARAEPSPERRLRAETRLIRTWIDHRLLADEPALQQLAWVQYGFESPLQRTERFAAAYLVAYRTAFVTHFPDLGPDKRQPIDPVLALNDLGVINALWKARALADKVGMPYDLFLDVVISGHLVNDKWTRPPRPNQLYGKLAEPRLRDKLTPDEVGERLFGPDWDDRFRAKHYSGHPVQEAALLALRNAVRTAPDPDAALADYLGAKQAITMERARDLLGEQAVERATPLAAKRPVSHVPEPRPHVPACIGLINVGQDSICQECPVSDRCAELKRRATDDMVALHGTDDPRADWKRQKTKLRMRRMRHRRQTASLESLLGADASPTGQSDDSTQTPEA
jgi:hypothetical protein